MKLTLINEDGTTLDDFPKNPLEEKWKKLYPPVMDICKLKSNYENYLCLECSKCPEGEDFQVPEEDIEIWNEYLRQIDEYDKIHNPSIYKIKQKVKNKTK